MTEELYNDLGPFESWSGLVDFYRKRLEEKMPHQKTGWDNWLFRGMQNANWELKSSLERAVERAQVDNHDVNNKLAIMEKREDGLLRRFKRQAHHYVSDVPADDAWMEWQALMQHFGAPTRLLDWTYSFFVGVFFAIENMDPGQTCAIWAFDSTWWYGQALELLANTKTKDNKAITELIRDDPNTKKPETVRAILLENPASLVFPINSDRLNERLAIQQGAFLVPSRVNQPFIKNLKTTSGNYDPKPHLLKINLALNSKELEKALRDLNSMNINRATLFPGLDGFSTHFKNLLFMPELIAPLRERLRGPG